MPDVFITLEEAAAFESVSYKTLTQRIYRNPQQYKTKSQAREGGGKDRVLISTSSLSAKARKAWRAVQKVEGSEVIIDKRAQEAVPWYVTADLNQYTEANKKRFYEAVELAARVQDFIDYDGPDRTGYAERYALGLGISPQSLYRYMKNVLEANAWALKLEKEDGKSRDYFRAVFNAIGRFSPEKAMIVGDSLTSDIAGGKTPASTPAGTIRPARQLNRRWRRTMKSAGLTNCRRYWKANRPPTIRIPCSDKTGQDLPSQCQTVSVPLTSPPDSARITGFRHTGSLNRPACRHDRNQNA